MKSKKDTLITEYGGERGYWELPMRYKGKTYGEKRFVSIEPIQRETPKVNRNDACPCGSGKKYKKCCM